MIRAATAADIPALRELARPFFARSHYATLGVLCDDASEALALLLLRAGIFLVAEVEGTIVGMLGAIVTPMLVDGGTLGASEVVFFVREDMRAARGMGRRLLLALEAECRARGLRFLQMHAIASSPKALFTLYRKQGFRPTEASYTKVL
jgi:GNAT superfamily N-acetyltransferase